MERNPKNNKRRVFNKEVDPESFFLNINKRGAYVYSGLQSNKLMIIYKKTRKGIFGAALQFEPFDLNFICTYTLSAYKCHKGNSKKVIIKKFRKWFYSCTCILPDYVSDESSKEF